MFEKIKKFCKKIYNSEDRNYIKNTSDYINKKHKAFIDAQIQRQNDISKICDEHLEYIKELMTWFEEQDKLVEEKES